MTQLKIGVIGVCGRGGEIARLWEENENSTIVAGMDPSDTALENFRKNINAQVKCTKDLDEFLNIKEIDAVAVASPDYTHEEYAVKAFQAGKHVFLEKPMAITTESCDNILAAWKKSGKKLMVGFNMRYMNLFRVMKEVVDSGAIGEVKAVWCRHFVGHGGKWYFHDWHGNSENSTGLLLQKASHDIDMIHWITGKYTRKVVGMGGLEFYGGNEPDDLRCPQCEKKETCPEFQHFGEQANKMDMCVFRKEIDVEDTSTIMMELEDGIKVNYMQCHYTPDCRRNYTFIGTEGRIENIDDDSKIIVKMRDKSNRCINLADQVLQVKPATGSHSGADPIMCNDFVNMIFSGENDSTPLDARMSVAVGCAGTESIRNDSKVVLIPE